MKAEGLNTCTLLMPSCVKKEKDKVDLKAKVEQKTLKFYAEFETFVPILSRHSCET